MLHRHIGLTLEMKNRRVSTRCSRVSKLYPCQDPLHLCRYRRCPHSLLPRGRSPGVRICVQSRAAGCYLAVSVDPVVRVCKLKEIIDRAVVPQVLLSRSVDEICQYKGTLSKSVPYVRAVPTHTEFSCCSRDVKFPCCPFESRFDEVDRCAPIGHVDVVGEC